MFLVSLSLFLLFASRHQTAAEQQRCLLKEGMEAKFSEDMRIEILRETSSADECANACYNHQTCDSFQYNDYNHECVLFKGAYPNPNSMSSNITSGWCPKGLKSYEVATTEGVDEKVTPPTSYSFQCSAETGERCQFPFGVKGEDGVQWSCVGEEGQAKCSPGSNDATSSWTTDKKLRIFQSQSNFHNCVDCNLSGIQLPCPFFGVIYIGFPLGTYAGVENWEECQLLCQMVDGCNFFNYGGQAFYQKQHCYLKYGLGRKKTGVYNRRVFGPKYCPVDCMMRNISTIGSCEAPCESKSGLREVLWSEKIVSPAKYGGRPCDRQEGSWVESEQCTLDEIVPCSSGMIMTVDCEMDATVQKKGLCQCIGGRKVTEVVTNWTIIRNASNGGKECEHIEGPAISLQECKSSNLACPSTSEAALGFLLALFLFTSLLLVAWIHNNQREKCKNLSANNLLARVAEPMLGNHIVLEKDGELKRNAINLIRREKQLEEEFLWLEAFDKEKINATMLRTVSVKEGNRPHNRYIDIAPYDDNYVSLTSELFAPLEMSSYVNASRIKFDNCAQTFIACNAPKPNSFSHFWHMVIQEKVSLIVMITRLVEGQKVKANQYWPDSVEETRMGPELKVAGGITIHHLSTSFQGSYFFRKFSISIPGDESREVVQLHTEDWPDLGVPDGPRVLVDLMMKTQSLQQSSDPILVHCSAGVGRTGTFIALYKLWLNYLDPSVTSLAILPTVLAMRHQRCKMVQKLVQYCYIAKCLSFLLGDEEGDYYEGGDESEPESDCDLV